MSTVHELVERQGAVIPDRTFLVDWSGVNGRGVATTFKEFASRVRRAAVFLSKSGVVEGSRVAFMSHPCLEYFCYACAAIRCGAVVVNLNYRHPPLSLVHMLQVTQCNMLVTDITFLSSARQLIEEWPNGLAPACIVLNTQLQQLHTTTLTPTELDGSEAFFGEADSEEQNAPFAKVHPSTYCLIMFTSGSTALPKAVPHTHYGLLWSVRAKFRAEGYTGRAVRVGGSGRHKSGAVAPESHRGTLCFLPIFHVMGFTNNFLFNLLAGVRVAVLTDQYDPPPSLQGPALTPAVLLQACTELRPSVIDTVPWLLQAVVEVAQRRAEEESESENDSVTVAAILEPLIASDAVLYGGCSLSPYTQEVFDKLGVRCASQYGQTELGGCTMLGDVEGAHPTMPASAMTLFAGVDFYLRSESRSESQSESGGDSDGDGDAAFEGGVDDDASFGGSEVGQTQTAVVGQEGELVLLGQHAATPGYIGQGSGGGSGGGVGTALGGHPPPQHATGDIFRVVAATHTHAHTHRTRAGAGAGAGAMGSRRIVW